MVTYKPFSSYVIYDGESSTFGGGGTPSNTIGIVTNFSPTFKNNLIRIYGVGDGRNAEKVAYGNLDLSGSIEFQVTTFDFLKFIVGPKTGSGTSADPYVLTEANDYSQSDSSGIQTFTMEVAGYDETTDDVETYVGCWGISATLNFSIEAPLSCTFNWGAKSVTGGTTAAGYTSSSRTPYLMQSGTFKWGTTPSTVSKVQSGSITINNNPVVVREVGDRTVVDVAAGQRQYDFTIELIMTDALRTTLEQDLYGQTVSSGPADGVSDPNPPADKELSIVFAISGTDTAEILLNDCYLEERTKPIPLGNDLIKVTYTGYAKSGGNTTNAKEPFRWWTS